MHDGVSRSFIPGLYLSNSIYPFGATHLATGYLAAHEVAEDLGCRDVGVVARQALRVVPWANLADIPLNQGVDDKWNDDSCETGGGGMSAETYDADRDRRGPNGLICGAYLAQGRQAGAAHRASPRDRRRLNTDEYLRLAPQPARRLPHDERDDARLPGPRPGRASGSATSIPTSWPPFRSGTAARWSLPGILQENVRSIEAILPDDAQAHSSACGTTSSRCSTSTWFR